MSRSSIAHAETIGRRVHWLVEVEIGGFVYRASDEDVAVTDANGNVWNYACGLGELAMRISDDGADGAAVSLAADVQGTPDGWPSVVLQSPQGSPATIRRWVEGQVLDDARVMFDGEITNATWDGADDPLVVRVAWRQRTPKPVPPPQAQINAATWPLPGASAYTPDESVFGAAYPLVFGRPGYRADAPWGATIVTAYATPGYLAQHSAGVVAYSGSRIGIGWVPDGTTYHATTVSVYRAHDDTTNSSGRGFAMQSLTVSTVTDSLGYTVATVTPGAWTGANTTVKFAPNKQYWIRWNDGGGVYNQDRSGPMRKAGEIAAYLLGLAGLTVDAGKMATARGKLDRYLLDFAMVESESDVRGMIESRLGVPLARRQGENGMWYEALNYAPRPEDAVLHLVRLEHESDVSGWFETQETTYAPRVLVEKSEPISYTDEEIANTVTVRYALDRGKAHTQEIVVTGGVPDSARYEIGSVVCAASRARYGELIGPVVELRMVHDQATAEIIALDTAARMAYPRRLTGYVGDVADLEVVEVSDIVRVTDRERNISNALALVRSVDYTLTTIGVQVEVLDYLSHIGSV